MTPAVLTEASAEIDAIAVKDPNIFSLGAGKAACDDRVGITSGDDGATLSISFGGDVEVYSPTYLLIEGFFYHAKHNPNSLCVRLPTSQENGAFEDVSYRQAASIVQFLTTSLQEKFVAAGVALGQDTVIAVLALPSLHSFFHCYAIWQLGCTVQWFNHELGRTAVDQLIGNSSGKGTSAAVLLHFGLTQEEKVGIGLSSLSSRIGVQLIEVDSDEFAYALTQRHDLPVPRDPVDQKEFNTTVDENRILFCIHTSGSTGIPKIVRWSLYAASCFMKLPPHVQMSFDNYDRPLLLVSRAYWGSSSFLMLDCTVMGTSLAFVFPENRLYATTKLTLDAASSCKAASILLYPAQAPELCDMVRESKHYEDIVTSIPTIQWCGAAMDKTLSENLAALNVPTIFVNLHGMSEIGFTGMMTYSAPYNGLQNLSSYALWEPVFQEERTMTRLVKLWIAIDRHPVVWYMAAHKHSPLEVKRFPGPGLMQNRPAIDTGDIFEERIAGADGGSRYFHHSRDDDLIRLSNLYRPDVAELEAIFTASLIGKGRLPACFVDAVQILGDKKPHLALVLQLRNCDMPSFPTDIFEESFVLALQDLNEQLPASVRFRGLDRVKIVSQSIQSGKNMNSEALLLKTHKGTLKRRMNVIKLTPWLDSLDTSIGDKRT
ncbi:hypothetical protein CBS101457_006946 [Exobasidium rhododendri]|nr:hypothetical protein CBS101457_006946 [Exobasidium rhododendri]